MNSENLPYDQWIEDSLRGVIRRAIQHVQKFGFPGNHHYYISFNTKDTGVSIPAYLKAQHPEDMTIVLQYQYEDLIVEDSFFSVSLRFNGKPETLVIPFTSITSFADPSVDFGLQLKTLTAEQVRMLEEDPSLDEVEDSSVAAQQTISQEIETESDVADGPEKTGEVIALDSFRKK